MAVLIPIENNVQQPLIGTGERFKCKNEHNKIYSEVIIQRF